MVLVFLAPEFMRVFASDSSAESDVVVGKQELRRQQPPACREYLAVCGDGLHRGAEVGGADF